MKQIMTEEQIKEIKESFSSQDLDRHSILGSLTGARLLISSLYKLNVITFEVYIELDEMLGEEVQDNMNTTRHPNT